MKRWIGVLSFVAVIACLDYGIERARTQSSPPVTVEWLTPTNGEVISGTINLTVDASSLAGPIVYVDYYCDDKWIARVYNTNYLPGPSNLAAKR